MKIKLLFALLAIGYSTCVFGSVIRSLPPNKLYNKAELIIFGRVSNIESDDALDYLTVEVIDCLKGIVLSKSIKVVLQVRGGLKEFDPILKKSDYGVFYLRKSGNRYASAYAGSIAVFTKHVFEDHPSNN
jgi:hypothetical protein